MKKIYLVDSENVGDVWVPLLVASQEEDVVLVFYTQKSPHMNYENVRMLKETEKDAVFIKCFEGSNALDFQLVTELGYMLREDADCEYVIVSNDTGFDAVVRYWSVRKMPVRRINGKDVLRQINSKEQRREKSPSLKKQEAVETDAVQSTKAAGAVEAATESTFAGELGEFQENEQLTAEMEGTNPIAEAESKAVEGAEPITEAESKAVEGAEPITEAESEASEENAPATETDAARENNFVAAETEAAEEKDSVAAETEAAEEKDSAAIEIEAAEEKNAAGKSNSAAIEIEAAGEKNLAVVESEDTEEEMQQGMSEEAERTVRALFCCIGKDNLADFHNVLVMFFGEETGKELYQEIKGNPEWTTEWARVPECSQKEKFDIYCQQVFLHSELAENYPQDFAAFLLKANGKRKNLNSLRAALQGQYGKDKGMKYYSLFKSHIKIMNRM